MKKIIIATAALAALACGKEPEDRSAAAPAGDPKAPAAAAPSAPIEPAPAPPAAVPETDEHADPDMSAEAAGRVPADMPPEAAAVPGEIPTAEDFEEKASKDVDKGNLETEVSRMETELGVDKK
jgi:hypothetical protein